MPFRLEDDLIDEEPPTIDPYAVLELSKDADEQTIKRAYRKAALKHHPDKAPEHLKPTAHITFQRIAFAYAILSDRRRRRRYDATGSTSESLLDDSDGDFNWRDFYRARYEDVITTEAITTFSKEYKGSDEERNAVLKAYKACKGSLNGVYEMIMLSNPLTDEERFRGYIDQAIAKGKAEKYDKYTGESAKSKRTRMDKARKEEAVSVEDFAKKHSMNHVFKKVTRDSGDRNGDASLAALIQQKQKGRAEGFLANLEAKYAPQANGKGKGKKRAAMQDDGEDDGPSEAAFAATARRLDEARKKRAEGEVVEVSSNRGRKAKKMKS